MSSDRESSRCHPPPDETRRSRVRLPVASTTGAIAALAALALLFTTPSGKASEEASASLDAPLPERGRLGPFRLHTDVEDDELLRRLDRVARETVDAYAEFLGVRPQRLEALDLYLFQEPARYLAYADASAPALHTKGGHTTRGAAAVVVGGRGARDVAPVLIHELVHLLNQASFQASSPPWLEEGLANAFSYSRISVRYRVQFDSLNGRMELGDDWKLAGSESPLDPRYLGHVETTGGKAAVKKLVDRLDARALLPTETLARVPWGPFRDLRVREPLYVHSGLFLRFLLLSEDGRYSEGVRSYLEALEDETASPGSLVDHLAVSWSDLDVAFQKWLRLEAFTAGVDRHSSPAWIQQGPDDRFQARGTCREGGIGADRRAGC